MPTLGKDEILHSNRGTSMFPAWPWLLTGHPGLIPRSPPPGPGAHQFLSLPFQVCVAAVAPYAPGTKGWLTTSSLRIPR